MRPFRPNSIPWLSTCRHAERVAIAHPTWKYHIKVTAVLNTNPHAAAHLRTGPLPWQQQIRSQHNSSSDAETLVPRSRDDRGPHKEYFQTPGQAPRPDLTPYDRGQSGAYTSSRDGHRTYFQNGAQNPAQQQQQSSSSSPLLSAVAGRDSIPRRMFRSAIYIIFFFAVGSAAGSGLITWEYLSPMFVEGSEEEKELIEEILDTIDDSVLVNGLREDGWREVDISSPPVAGHKNLSRKTLAANLDTDGDGKDDVQGRAQGIGMGRHMLFQILTGSKGLVGMKMFYHPEQEYSLMVFFTGFGIEDLPDKLHDGMVSTLLEEAVRQHVDWYYRGHYDGVKDMGIRVDFKKPVQPGDVYAILVPPAAIEPVAPSQNAFPGMSSGLSRMKIVGLFMHLDGPPKVSSNVSAASGGMVEHKIEVPGRSSQGPDVHAVAEVTMNVQMDNKNAKSFLDSIAESNAKFGGHVKRNSDEEIEEK